MDLHGQVATPLDFTSTLSYINFLNHSDQVRCGRGPGEGRGHERTSSSHGVWNCWGRVPRTFLNDVLATPTSCENRVFLRSTAVWSKGLYSRKIVRIRQAGFLLSPCAKYLVCNKYVEFASLEIGTPDTSFSLSILLIPCNPNRSRTLVVV